MSKNKVLLVMIIAMTIFILSNAVFSELSFPSRSETISPLIKAAGYIGPAISSECTATRNPILESICACLGDLPGGYCYHLSCGIVGVPVMTEQPNQIDIARQ